MKPTSEILERITKSSTEHKDGVFTRLYRYLLREDIYFAAYQKLYANRGAITKSIDNDTADHFSQAYVNALIQELRDGTYRAKPVRREYIAKKTARCDRWEFHPSGISYFKKPSGLFWKRSMNRCLTITLTDFAPTGAATRH